jgi:hypothetical protein
MTDKFNPDSWAEKAQKRLRQCGTCACSEDALEALRIVMRAVAEGRSNVSQTMVADMLAEHYGYRLGHSALRNHMKSCEPELWAQTWGKK